MRELTTLRYDLLKVLAQKTTDKDLFVTSLGELKNEWYDLMPGPGTFFQSVLGGCTAVAFGMAVALPHRRIISLDTDGGMLMGACHMATLANEAPPNLTVIVFDNESYQGVGGHPTHTAGKVDLSRWCAGAGVEQTATIWDVDQFSAVVEEYLNDDRVGFITAKISYKSYHLPSERRKNSDEKEDKYRFIRYVEQMEGLTIKPQHRAKKGVRWSEG